MNNQRRCLLLSIALCAPLVFVGAKDDWLRSVPASARVRTNPLAADADAPLAGALLHKRNCASCHGIDGAGSGSRPSLQTSRVHNATDGELEWLLTNGNLAHGMPSWSRLPESQRWQLVRFLRTLPTSPDR